MSFLLDEFFLYLFEYFGTRGSRKMLKWVSRLEIKRRSKHADASAFFGFKFVCADVGGWCYTDNLTVGIPSY